MRQRVRKGWQPSVLRLAYLWKMQQELSYGFERSRNS